MKNKQEYLILNDLFKFSYVIYNFIFVLFIKKFEFKKQKGLINVIFRITTVTCSTSYKIRARNKEEQ